MAKRTAPELVMAVLASYDERLAQAIPPEMAAKLAATKHSLDNFSQVKQWVKAREEKRLIDGVFAPMKRNPPRTTSAILPSVPASVSFSPEQVERLILAINDLTRNVSTLRAQVTNELVILRRKAQDLAARYEDPPKKG